MSGIRKILVISFLILNFLAMARVHLPLENTFFKKVFRPVDTYLSFFSIYQDWYMFAPNPTRMNIRLSANVEYFDGSVETYQFPHTTEMGLFDKYTHGEKFRKIISEGIRKDSHSWMWKDTAKFVLKKMKENNISKIPIKVHLFRHWAETPKLDKQFLAHGSRIPNENSYSFYTYEVF